MTQHFNRLSPAEAERLAMLAEEAGEIVQAVGKVLRHGYSSRHPDGGRDNRHHLRREVDDLRAVIGLMEAAGDLPPINSDVADEIILDEATRRKLRYAHHQGGGQ